MTLSQFAKRHNIARQNLYNKIKDAGLDLQALRDPQTKQLSPQGVGKLQTLLSKRNVTVKVTQKSDDTQKYIDEIAKMQERIKQLQDTKAFLEGQLAALQQDKARADARLDDFIASNKDQLSIMKAAMDEQANIIKLMSGEKEKEKEAPVERKLTWKERFSGKIVKK